jgi:hypothetical protein
LSRCSDSSSDAGHSPALFESVREHPLFAELDNFDKTLGPLDLYQGSRLVAKWAEICTTHLRRAKKTLLPEAMNIPLDILANAQISKVEMHAQISRLDTTWW